MQIAFWSNVRGRAGNTSLTASISATIGLEHRLNTVIVNSNKQNCLSRLFEGDGSHKFSGSGVMNAYQLARANKLNSSNIKHYCRTQVKNGCLDLFEDNMWCENQIFMEEKDAYKRTIECLKDSYDVVCYDIGAGLENKLCNYIMEQSDLIIVSMNQDRREWSYLVQLVRSSQVFKNKSVLYVANRYDNRSRVKVSNIKRELGIDWPIAIPYDVDFMDSCHEGKILDYLLRNYKCGKEEDGYFFINQVKDLAGWIVDSKREAI